MNDKYAPRWAEYRRISRYAAIAFTGFIAIPFLIVAVFALLLRFSLAQLPTDISDLAPIVGAAFMLVAMAFVWRLYTWTCPRCGERFGWRHEECQHCSLPKWANGDDGTDWRTGRI